MISTSHTDRIGNRTVHYLTLGTGPDLVFLHGWGLSPRAYQPLLTRLAHRGHRVIAPALPGFGGSSPLSPACTLDAYAAHLEEFLARHVDRPHLAGHSLGGGIALRLATRTPHDYSGLALASPVGGARNTRHTLARTVLSAPLDWHPSWAPQALLATGIALTRPLSLARTGRLAWAARQDRDLEHLAHTSLPVRLINATRDSVVPPHAAIHAPNITTHTVTGRHSWPLTYPDVAAHHLTSPTP